MYIFSFTIVAYSEIRIRKIYNQIKTQKITSPPQKKKQQQLHLHSIVIDRTGDIYEDSIIYAYRTVVKFLEFYLRVLLKLQCICN